MPKYVCTVKVDQWHITGSCGDTETGEVRLLIFPKAGQEILKKIAEAAGWELRWE